MTEARILIVEDEAIIAMEIEASLQNLGYEVTSVVNTGDKAIAKAEADKPDLILMDIRIQGDKDGIETAEIIRNQFGIPVVFSTAYLDEERIERAKITMPFGYVLKPIQERDLKVTIEMALYVAKVDAERRDAEKALKSSETKYCKVYGSIADPIFVFDKKTHRFLDCNQSALKRYGYSFDELLTMTPHNLHPNGEIERVENNIDDEETSPHSYTHITKKGEKLYVEIHTDEIDYDDQKAWISIVRDITERKQAEEALKESEKRLKEAEKVANMGHWEMDIETRESIWSDQFFRICGFEPGAFKPTAEKGFQIIHPDDRDRVQQEVEKAIEQKGEYNLKKRIVRPDGSVRFVHSKGVIVFDENSKSSKLTGTFLDITE